MEQLQDNDGTRAAGHPQPVSHQVEVSVDGTTKTVLKGKYVVSEFKTVVGVPADYELDQVVDGKFEPLADDATIHVKEGEVFVSHVRRGGSS